MTNMLRSPFPQVTAAFRSFNPSTNRSSGMDSRRLLAVGTRQSHTLRSARVRSSAPFLRCPLTKTTPIPRALDTTTSRVFVRYLSTNDSASLLSSPLDWWRGRQETKQAEQDKQHLRELSEKDRWTLGDFETSLKDKLNQSWIAKTLSDNKETKMAQELQYSIAGMIDVVGKDATSDDLDSLSRKQKLQAAAKAKTTVDTMNQMIQQFGTTALVHKVLRQRKLDGKPIPTSMDSIQTIVQAEGVKLLSKKQKERVLKAQRGRVRTDRRSKRGQRRR